MKRSNGVRIYNIMLPLWIILFLPTWLWLILIPVNYLIDRIVLRWSLGDMPEKGLFCRKHTWKICLAGFLSDFAGAAVMLCVFMLSADLSDSSILENLAYGVGFNPFSHLLPFLVVAAAVAFSGALIYLIDKAILKKAGLAMEQVKKSALRLALFTAPYLFFFPSSVIYDSRWFSL